MNYISDLEFRIQQLEKQITELEYFFLVKDSFQGDCYHTNNVDELKLYLTLHKSDYHVVHIFNLTSKKKATITVNTMNDILNLNQEKIRTCL